MNVKNIILSRQFSVFFVLFALFAYFIISYCFSLKYGFFDIEEVGITEILTYLFYGVGFGIIISYEQILSKEETRKNFYELIFLWAVALLREMGIQHWLTTHDTVVTKIRFFTNATNPLYEKIIAAFLFFIVIYVLLSLLVRNFKYCIKGLTMKIKPTCITIAVFIILAILTQIADRYPAIYYKECGIKLSEHILFILKIFEEGGESILPLLFGIGIYQYCNK